MVRKSKSKLFAERKKAEIRRSLELFREGYGELCNRKVWLLWHVKEFRQDFKLLSSKIYRDSRRTNNWLSVYDLIRWDYLCDEFRRSNKLPDSWFYDVVRWDDLCDQQQIVKDFVQTYGLSCYQYNILSDYTLFDMIKLIDEAEKGKWGLDMENFRRDREWFELRIDWPALNEVEREWMAKEIVALSGGSKKKWTVEKLLATKKLPYRVIALLTYARHPVVIDRLVLGHLKKQDSALLYKVGWEKRSKRVKGISAEWNDSHLLYKLGILKKVKGKQNEVLPIPEIEYFPVASEDSKKIAKGREYFVRFNYPFVDKAGESDDSYLFEAVMNDTDDKRQRGLRREFIEERESYREEKGLSDCERTIRQAVVQMNKKIRFVRSMYLKKANPKEFVTQ